MTVKPGRLWRSLLANEANRPVKRSLAKTISAKFPWLGPGLWISSLVYFVVQVVVASFWTRPYSWSHNSISDLGDTSCGSAVCSPQHLWMNVEFFILGIGMAAGSWLIYTDFAENGPSERLAARIGFSCLALAGIGTIVVGGFPENTVSVMHIIGAAFGIGAGTLGILVLGLVLGLPPVLRWSMRVVMPIALVALGLFAVHWDLGVGAGTIERVAAYPETIWLIAFGLYVSRKSRGFTARGTGATLSFGAAERTQS